IGRTKASVLPEPVGDSARTSRPASASGMTSDWTAKGSVMARRGGAPAAGEDARGGRRHAEIGERRGRHRGAAPSVWCGRFDGPGPRWSALEGSNLTGGGATHAWSR